MYFFYVGQQFSSLWKGVQALFPELAEIRPSSVHRYNVPHVASMLPKMLEYSFLYSNVRYAT
jgi:hypothetical protein